VNSAHGAAHAGLFAKVGRLAPLALLATLALAATLGLANSPSARASGQTLAPATTKIGLYWLPFLRGGGVELGARQPAQLRGSIVSLPNLGGSFDSRTGEGTIAMGGEIWLRSKRRRAQIRAIELNTRRSALYAELGSKRLKLADAAKLISRPNGIVIARGLTLSGQAAARLNQILRLPHFFRPCLPVATSISRVGAADRAAGLLVPRRPAPERLPRARSCLLRRAS
jgi:hypothetical protein